MSWAEPSATLSLEAANVSTVKPGRSTGETAGTVVTTDGGMPPQQGPQSTGHEQSRSSSGGSGAACLFGQQLSPWAASTVVCFSCALQGATQASDHALVTAASTTSNSTRVMRGRARRGREAVICTGRRLAQAAGAGEQATLPACVNVG
jgi:hypothetical protein